MEKINKGNIILLSLILLIFPVSAQATYDDCEIYGNCHPIVSASVSSNTSATNVNSSNFWGNYLWTDYNMPLIKSFGYNQSAGYVPYSGADANVDLGSYNLSTTDSILASQIVFDTTFNLPKIAVSYPDLILTPAGGGKIIINDGLVIVGRIISNTGAELDAVDTNERFLINAVGNDAFNWSVNPLNAMTNSIIATSFKLLDNNKYLAGTSDDASIYYNSSDMIIDGAEVGSGMLVSKTELKIEQDDDVSGLVLRGFTNNSKNGQFFINSAGSFVAQASSNLLFSSLSSGVFFRSAGAYDVVMQDTNTRNVQMVTGGGKVGVNASAPKFVLDVHGDTNVTEDMRARDYYSGDGSQGLTTSIYLNSSCTLTFKDGLLTGGCT